MLRASKRLALGVVSLAAAFGVCADQPLPVGQLQSREFLVIVYKASGELMYTVQTHEGETLARLLPLPLLAARFPKLASDLQRSLAAFEESKPSVWGSGAAPSVPESIIRQH